MESLSSSLGILGSTDEDSWSDDVGHFEILSRILKPSQQYSSNWLSGDVAFHLEYHDKLDLAFPYFSKLMREHPSWPDTIVGSVGACTSSKENNIHEYKKLLENFRHKLGIGLSQFEQRFSLVPACLISMVCSL